MADSTVSNLPLAGVPQPADLFLLAQSGESRKLPFSALSDKILSLIPGTPGMEFSIDSAAPNNLVNVSVMKSTAPTTNADIAIVPKGTGAFLLGDLTGTAVNGNKRGVYSVDMQRYRNAATQVASGSYSLLGSGSNNTVSGTYNAIVSGSYNGVSAGTYNAIAGGEYNVIQGSDHCFIGSGNNNVIAGAGATGSVILGTTNILWHGSNFLYNSVISGGIANLVDSSYAIIPGGRRASTRGLLGAYVWGGSGCNLNNMPIGAMQRSKFLLFADTANAGVSRPMSLASGDGVLPRQVAIPDRATYSCKLWLMIRREQNATNPALAIATYEYTFGISRGVGAGTTVLIGAPVAAAIAPTTGTLTPLVTISADVGLGGINIQVTDNTVGDNVCFWFGELETLEIVQGY